MKEKLPESLPNFQEISKQMRINADILKLEISDHVDKEIQRFRKEMKICSQINTNLCEMKENNQ